MAHEKKEEKNKIKLLLSTRLKINDYSQLLLPHNKK